MDLSNEKIRNKINSACESGKRYVVLRRSKDKRIDSAVQKNLDTSGYKVSMNARKIVVSW